MEKMMQSCWSASKSWRGHAKGHQDKKTSLSMQIGTMIFMSQSQVKVWMDLNRCLPHTCLYFLDATSMLVLVHSISEPAKFAAEFGSLSMKVCYTSLDEVLVITSFRTGLPGAFSLLLKSFGVAHDSWVLPALPSYKEWDGGDGYNSLCTSLG